MGSSSFQVVGNCLGELLVSNHHHLEETLALAVSSFLEEASSLEEVVPSLVDLPFQVAFWHILLEEDPLVASPLEVVDSTSVEASCPSFHELSSFTVLDSALQNP